MKKKLKPKDLNDVAGEFTQQDLFTILEARYLDLSDAFLDSPSFIARNYIIAAPTPDPELNWYLPVTYEEGYKILGLDEYGEPLEA